MIKRFETSREFFGPVPYPIDLGVVEQRANTRQECGLLNALVSECAVEWRAIRVLDICCGRGRHLRSLSHESIAVRLGCDFVKENLIQAQAADHFGMFVCAELEKLPVAANCIEFAYCLYSSVGLDRDNLVDLFRETSRVLVTEGVFLLHYSDRGAERSCRVEFERIPGGLALILQRVDDKWIKRTYVCFQRKRGVSIYVMRRRRYRKSHIIQVARKNGLEVQMRRKSENHVMSDREFYLFRKVPKK